MKHQLVVDHEYVAPVPSEGNRLGLHRLGDLMNNIRFQRLSICEHYGSLRVVAFVDPTCICRDHGVEECFPTTSFIGAYRGESTGDRL